MGRGSRLERRISTGLALRINHAESRRASYRESNLWSSLPHVGLAAGRRFAIDRQSNALKKIASCEHVQNSSQVIHVAA